jgi:hypothetical protein
VSDNGFIGRSAGAAKNISVIATFLSGIVGVLIGAIGVLFYLRDELKTWDDIKNAHRTVLQGANPTTIYDHQDLDDVEIAAIKKKLDLPDFKNFVTKSDLSGDVSIVRYTVPIKITAIFDSETRLLGAGDGTGVNAAKKDSNFAGTYEWHIEKSTN